MELVVERGASEQLQLLQTSFRLPPLCSKPETIDATFALEQILEAMVGHLESTTKVLQRCSRLEGTLCKHGKVNSLWGSHTFLRLLAPSGVHILG